MAVLWVGLSIFMAVIADQVQSIYDRAGYVGRGRSDLPQSCDEGRAEVPSECAELGGAEGG